MLIPFVASSVLGTIGDDIPFLPGGCSALSTPIVRLTDATGRQTDEEIHHETLGLGRSAFAVTLVLAYHLGPTIYHLSNDRAALEAFLDAAGIWAPLGFILLVASQVILAPIPSFLTGIAGGFIFGILPGFLLNLAGMLLGAMVAFSMVRIGGKPLVDRFLGPRYGHWLARINGRRGALVIGAIFLVPFLPDDAICWLAALTPIRARLLRR